MSQNNVIFESLHKDYQAMVLQMCRGFVKGDEDLAKDISQEVFINVWNALEDFRGEAKYKTWIYRITVNTCLHYLRQARRKEQLSMDDVSQNLVYQQQPLEETANHTLYRAIGQLSKVDRLIIMMVLDELEKVEISEVMGISPGNLRVKIHRIKKKLREIVRKEQANG